MKIYNSLPKLLVPLLLLSSTLAIAAPKSNQQLTNELAGLQKGVAEVQKYMQRLQRLLDNRAMLELFQRMDELSDEVSQLRGMLEEQSHDIAGIKKRQRELYLDIDRRLRELEITSSRPAAPAVPALPPATSQTQTTVPSQPAIAPAPVQPSVPTQPTVVDNTPKIPKPATIAGSTRPPAPVSDERAAYQKAFDMLKEGRYKMANTSFKTFLGRYPQSSYAGNAQYWLGESNYVTRQFDQAVNEFKAVLQNYPSSNKVPDAMLKLGYTYYELGQFDSARQMLEQLRKRNPNSTAARLAVKRLDRMKREGR